MQSLGDDYGKSHGRKPVVAAPVTAQEVAQTKAELKRLQGSLRKWLKFRKGRDEMAAGTRPSRVPPRVLAKTLVETRDWAHEQRIALRLHALLSEIMDANTLPNPDVSKDPNAAVKLAELVVSKKLTTELPAPQAQGILPLLALPIVALAGFATIAFIVSSNNDAELAAQKERQQYCLERGPLTLECMPIVEIGIAGLAAFIAYKAAKKQGWV